MHMGNIFNIFDDKVDIFDDKHKCWRIATVSNNRLMYYSYDGPSYTMFTEATGEYSPKNVTKLNTYTPIHRYLSKNNTGVIEECSTLVFSHKRVYQSGHRYYVDRRRGTVKCDICKKTFCSECTIIKRNHHVIVGDELCVAKIDGIFQCKQCTKKNKITLSCGNCHKNVCFNSKFDLKNGIDCNGYIINRYKSIYDKQKQITFCANCSKTNLPKCIHFNSIKQLCEPHPNCGVCNAVISTHSPVSCDICKKFIHKNRICGSSKHNNYRMLCKTCCVSMDITRFENMLRECLLYINMNISDDIIFILSEYAVGYIMKCSAVICDNQIGFNNTQQIVEKFDKNGNDISYYTVKTGTKFINTVKLLGQHKRIFCNECKQRVNGCSAPNCYSMDVEKQVGGTIGCYICPQHPICSLCNKPNLEKTHGLCEYCGGFLWYRKRRFFY